MEQAARLSAAQIAFLQRQRVAHLGTVDEAGRPHVVPICFAYVEGNLYTAIDAKPKRVAPGAVRRLRNIRANPDVCVLADQYEEDWTRLAWIQIHGRASLVEQSDEDRSDAIAALRWRYPQYRRVDLESLPLIRITPARVVEWSAG